jgi:hypothetical protein
MPKMVYDLPEVGPGSLPGSIPQVRMQGPPTGMGSAIEEGGRQTAQLFDRQAQTFNAMAQVAGQIQDDIDNASAKAADNALTEAIRIINFDPEKGYMAQEKKTALDVRGAAQDEIKKNVEKIRETLQNPMQKFMFDNAAQQRLSSAFLQMDSHAMSEAKAWAKEEAALRKKLAKEGAKGAAGRSGGRASGSYGLSDDDLLRSMFGAPGSAPKGGGADEDPLAMFGPEPAAEPPQTIEVQFADEFAPGAEPAEDDEEFPTSLVPEGALEEDLDWLADGESDYNKQIGVILNETEAEAKLDGVPAPDKATTLTPVVKEVANELVNAGKPLTAIKYVKQNERVGNILARDAKTILGRPKKEAINRASALFADELFARIMPEPDVTKMVSLLEINSAVASAPLLRGHGGFRETTRAMLKKKADEWNAYSNKAQAEAVDNLFEQQLAGKTFSEIAGSPAWGLVGGAKKAAFKNQFEAGQNAERQKRLAVPGQIVSTILATSALKYLTGGSDKVRRILAEENIAQMPDDRIRELRDAPDGVGIEGAKILWETRAKMNDPVEQKKATEAIEDEVYSRPANLQKFNEMARNPEALAGMSIAEMNSTYRPLFGRHLDVLLAKRKEFVDPATRIKSDVVKSLIDMKIKETPALQRSDLQANFLSEVQRRLGETPDMRDPKEINTMLNSVLVDQVKVGGSGTLWNTTDLIMNLTPSQRAKAYVQGEEIRSLGPIQKMDILREIRQEGAMQTQEEIMRRWILRGKPADPARAIPTIQTNPGGR